MANSILGLLCLIHTAIAFHNGAPCSTQYTMTPSAIFHGVAQNPGPRPPPYQFQILDSEGHVVKKYKDEVYKLKITAVESSFRGFILQARPASAEGYPIGHLRAGMFVPDGTWKAQGIKIQPCPGVFNDSLTHATNEDRTTLEVQWRPTKNHGPILFMLTIVQNRTLFWTQWLPSAGLILPEEGAVFASGDEKEGDASAKSKVIIEAGTASPHEEPAAAAAAGAESKDGEESTTVATTKRPRKKGSRKPKHRTTTTVAPDDITDAPEAAPEAPIDAKAPVEPKGKPATSESAPSSSGRLPPAPAAATGDSQEETKPVTKRPSKNKNGGVTTAAASGEATPGPDDDLGSPPLNPSNAGPLPPPPNGGLPPAAPAGTEETDSGPKGAGKFQPVPTLGSSGPEESDTTDYCAEKPCVNNGTCINIPDEERYDCRCPPDWAGPQCAYPNLCKKHKCKNGATCINGEDKYTCKCAREWAGDFCDKSCPAYLCENGGTCILSGDQYACICAPGYTGPRCHDEIKHCDSQPCQNGATCVHKFNSFECKCKDGYMGETCHRPCQDIYRSCDFWGEQEKCETQRPTTKWFDINCAKTCGQCKYDNHTAAISVPLPPVLEPFEFLLGKWTVNSTTKYRFPIDFIHNNSQGYFEELIFSVAEVPQFGPPSINFTAVATNNLNPQDVMVTVGFLTVRPATIPLKTFLMTTGNDGITAVEDGFTNNTVIQLNSTYFAILPWVDDRAPATAKRTISIANQYLKIDTERTTNSGQKDYFTQYYWRQEKYQIF